MSTEQDSPDSIEQVIEESTQRHIDHIIADARQNWKSQADKAKKHAESKAKYLKLARQHEESLQACLSVAEEREAKARALLIAQLGAEKILPRWEAAGDLAPPGFRQAFQDRSVPPPPDPVVPPRQQAKTPESSGISSLESESGAGARASSGVVQSVRASWLPLPVASSLLIFYRISAR